MLAPDFNSLNERPFPIEMGSGREHVIAAGPCGGEKQLAEQSEIGAVRFFQTFPRRLPTRSIATRFQERLASSRRGIRLRREALPKLICANSKPTRLTASRVRTRTPSSR